MTEPLGNVEVRQFAGLAVQFVRECDARVIIRGVRSLSDMDTEFTMTLANRKLDPGIETVFLMADEEFSHVSSSLIKQITPLASDEELARFVPRGNHSRSARALERTGQRISARRLGLAHDLDKPQDDRGQAHDGKCRFQRVVPAVGGDVLPRKRGVSRKCRGERGRSVRRRGLTGH